MRCYQNTPTHIFAHKSSLKMPSIERLLPLSLLITIVNTDDVGAEAVI